jgi:methionyl-tRNA formyltransferase
MLLSCIKDRLYLAGTDIREGVQHDQRTATARAAPKITPRDRFIDWDTWSAEEILRRNQIIGPLWSSARVNADTEDKRRIIWSTGFELYEDAPDVHFPIRQPVVVGYGKLSQRVFIRSCDNKILRIGQIKIEGGGQADPIQAALRASMNDSVTLSNEGLLFRFPLSSKKDAEKLSNPRSSTKGVA